MINFSNITHTFLSLYLQSKAVDLLEICRRSAKSKAVDQPFDSTRFVCNSLKWCCKYKAPFYLTINQIYTTNIWGVKSFNRRVLIKLYPIFQRNRSFISWNSSFFHSVYSILFYKFLFQFFSFLFIEIELLPSRRLWPPELPNLWGAFSENVKRAKQVGMLISSLIYF